ncbi:hypothetical protein Golomagni_05243 [Golovinomyces magnicellulatus]|nr:hypothetical protein Golomagni_05243 [Golovinomyces magnicellulatus]
MRITYFAIISSILYALVNGRTSKNPYIPLKTPLSIKKIEHDVLCPRDVVIWQDVLNYYGEYVCRRSMKHHPRNYKDWIWNVLNPYTVVYFYGGDNFKMRTDGSKLLIAHVGRPVFSLINYWYVVVALDVKNGYCEIIGAEERWRQTETECSPHHKPRTFKKILNINFRNIWPFNRARQNPPQGRV